MCVVWPKTMTSCLWANDIPANTLFLQITFSSHKFCSRNIYVSSSVSQSSLPSLWQVSYRSHQSFSPIITRKIFLKWETNHTSLLAFHCPNDEVHSSHYKLQALPDLVPPFLLLSAFLETILSFPSRSLITHILNLSLYFVYLKASFLYFRFSVSFGLKISSCLLILSSGFCCVRCAVYCILSFS